MTSKVCVLERSSGTHMEGAVTESRPPVRPGELMGQDPAAGGMEERGAQDMLRAEKSE